MNSAELTTRIRTRAKQLGFSDARICRAVEPTGIQRLDEWLGRGYAGEMHYIADRRDAYNHPRSVLDGVRSLVMLTLDYGRGEPNPANPGHGRISCYAWGERDYHDVIHGRLKQLEQTVLELAPNSQNRGVVDTAPLLERDFARLSGLGWIGKHTLLINRQRGSYFFLATLLTDLELKYDPPFEADHCGTCTACLDACPTHAFPEPYVLDARRCISYLTIELREMPPAELRPAMESWLFGCDVCQEVCPWNKSHTGTEEETFQPLPSSNPVDLLTLFSLDEAAFRERFRHTPLWRSRRRGILRNAAITLGNQRYEPAIDILIGALDDSDSLVRQAAAWALRQFYAPRAQAAVTARLAVEQDELVRKELAG